MNRYFLAALFLVGLLVGAAGADEVYLTNGDRVTGTIVRMVDGKLVIKTALAGEVTIPAGNIRTLNSEAPLEVHLTDGTVLNQPVQAIEEPGHFAIATGPTLQAQTFQVADLVSINPPPKPKPKWTGSISAGVTITTGNTETETYNASASAVRRSEKDRLTAGADFAKGERTNQAGVEETIEDWWRATAQYDYFFSKKFFAYVSGRYEKDGIALLDRRIVVGGGGGYQWIESPKTNFATALGVATVYEKYETASDGNDEVSLQASYTFDHQINKNVKFLHDLTYLPAFEDFGDFYLTSTAELRASLTQTMFANFKVIYNFDETPANNRESTDVKYIFGLGMTF